MLASEIDPKRDSLDTTTRTPTHTYTNADTIMSPKHGHTAVQIKVSGHCCVGPLQDAGGYIPVEELVLVARDALYKHGLISG